MKPANKSDADVLGDTIFIVVLKIDLTTPIEKTKVHLDLIVYDHLKPLKFSRWDFCEIFLHM